MRRLTSIVAAVAAIFALSSVNAAPILIDNFATPVGQQAVIDASGAVGGVTGAAVGTAPGSLATTRTIFADMLVPGAITNTGLNQSVTVGAGSFPASALTFATSPGVDQTATVTWSLAPVVLSGPVSLFFRVLNSNIGTLASGVELNTLAFSLNGSSLVTASIGNALNTDIFLALTPAQVASLASGGALTMVANGAPDWDLSMTSFALQVPEPASLALVGLGLIGAGVASRRRKAV
jgi:hypothetical protein